MTLFKFYITVLFLMLANIMAAQCHNNLLRNGELRGELGKSQTAYEWMAIGDPDMQDHNTKPQVGGTLWVYPILPSSDSSTWQNLISFERIFQTVKTEPGVTYSLSYEYASHVLTPDQPNSTFTTPLELNPIVWLDEIKSHESPTTLVGNQWYNDCFQFKATGNSLTVMFGHEDDGYIGFDNICMKEVFDIDTFEDFDICIGTDTIIKAPKTKYEGQISWSTGDTTDQIRIETPGSYWLDITGECGTHREQFEVTLDDCGCSLYIPDTFSPYLQGINNAFKVGSNCGLKEYEMEIYDKWGNLVFNSFNLSNSWNGTINTAQAQTGLYIYKIRYDFLSEEKMSVGTVHLIR